MIYLLVGIMIESEKMTYGPQLQLITTKHHCHPRLLFVLQNAINIQDSTSPANGCRFTITALLIWSTAPTLCSTSTHCASLHICVYR